MSVHGDDEGGRERGIISIAFVHEALQGLTARGLPADAVLHAAGISRELLALPQARVSAASYGLLWHAIARMLDDEFFGMDSHPMKVGSFTLLCHAIIRSPTLERALLRALRFLRLILDDIRGELAVEGERCRLVVYEQRPPQPTRAFAYGTFLMMLHGLACWLVGRRIPLHHAAFRCAEPAFSDEWRVLFSKTLHFEADTTEIVFDAEYLALPNLRDEPAMKHFLRAAPANFLVKFRNSSSLTAQIRRQLRELPPASWPGLEALAQAYGMSQATLRRRLEEEGQSYRLIVDDLRRDMAISLLSDTSLPMLEIAAELGFAESSAFHRAFRKWTGSRPGEYRHRLDGGAMPG